MPSPAAGPTEVRRPGDSGVGEAAAQVIVTEPAPRPPSAAALRRRSRRPLLVATANVVVLLVAGGAGLWWLSRPSGPAGPTPLPDDSPFPSPITLTSPPASHGPSIGDPDTPLYVEGQGFSPDAIRVLTVTALSLGLERYREDRGAYPADLVYLSFRVIPRDGRAGRCSPRRVDREAGGRSEQRARRGRISEGSG